MEGRYASTIRSTDDITFEDLARIFGYSNRLKQFPLSGSELKTVLENSVRGEGRSKGYFLQVSGLRVCYDRGAPEGRRVRQLERATDSGWAPVVPTAIYTVVAPAYIVGGGDGFTFPEHAKDTLPGPDLKYLALDDVLAAQTRGEPISVDYDPTNPRIANLAPGENRCFP